MRNNGLMQRITKLKQLFRKPKTTRFIHYSEPNQEPLEHREGKRRVRGILGLFGYILLDNLMDRKYEYKMPPVITSFIAETEKEKIRQYQIDCLMYNASMRKVIAVEVDGDYHFASKDAIRKTRLKRETIHQYLGGRNFIQIGKSRYEYDTYKFVSFREDELIGRYALDRNEIVGQLIY